MDVIIVKDYPIPGSQIIGFPYYGTLKGKKRDEEYYVLEDGDIYTIDELKQSFPLVRKIPSSDIIDIFGFKGKWEKEVNKLK